LVKVILLILPQSSGVQAKQMRRISVPQQSVVAPHDVAHASVRSRPEIWKVVRAAMRFEDREELTWLASCVRRILRQLMVAEAEEWRDGRRGGGT
jgi:hypothetical protein